MTDKERKIIEKINKGKEEQLEKIRDSYKDQKIYINPFEDGGNAEWASTDEFGDDEWMCKGHTEDGTPLIITYDVKRDDMYDEDGDELEPDMYDWDNFWVTVELEEAPDWSDLHPSYDHMIIREGIAKDVITS